MIISERDGVYSAQHITGPTHNLLRMRLRNGADADFPVTVLPPVGDCRHHDGLKAEEVIPAIRAGVMKANTKLGTDFAVEHAEIVENDSRQPAVYELLARRIVETAVAKSQ
ncbi:hypothetical protein ACFQ1E_07040 [Sphingomonas canadensis]|uniref:Uncharacterized protein n=1 Tax=Sphingomonas canadensis TaxID=1219257 RepID=A0ABW3H9I3_9SPHN|nr:hypothetical protein [Sphingomonas canadensis]MCW3835457.1 hypothetical protein [Sphingomonas canadensis]